MTLNFEGEANLLSAEFVKGNPDSLIASLKIENKIIEFEPVLMNEGDFFSAKVLIGQYSGKFDIDARIIGVKSIRRRQPQAEWYSRSAKFATIIIILCIPIIIYSYISIRRSKSTIEKLEHEIAARKYDRFQESLQVVYIPLSPGIGVVNKAISSIECTERVRTVGLKLLLSEEDNHQGYRARLQTREGMVLFITGSLPNLLEDGGKMAIIYIPCSTLPIGDYQINLYRQTSDGTQLPVSEYYFRVI